jgi:hypothetical protein
MKRKQLCEEHEREEEKRKIFSNDSVPFQCIKSAAIGGKRIAQERDSETNRHKRAASLRRNQSIYATHPMEIEPLPNLHTNNPCSLIHTRANCAVCGAQAIGIVLIVLNCSPFDILLSFSNA